LKSHYLKAGVLAGLLVAACIQPARAQTLEITAVQVVPTANGVDILLETPGNTAPEIAPIRQDNTLFADIANAQLNLLDNQPFRAVNPGPGIETVTVTQLENNIVRVEIVSTDPGIQATIAPSPSGLTVSAVTVSPEDADIETVDEIEEIELVITATRTAVAQANIPRSVTVINRDEIESQAVVSQNLGDLLGTLIPGFGPPTQSASNATQSLRGRQPSILIDGIPLNSNRRSFQELRSIDPAAVERIEVVRGATGIFGAEATGGVINIITRRPESEPLVAETTIGLGPYTEFGNFSDSFGWRVEQNISGRSENVDYLLNVAYLDTGAFFDGEGDRIPVGRAQGLDDLRSWNVLGKLGLNFDENQRLQFTFNYFNDKQDTSVVTDITVDQLNERVKARPFNLGDLEIDQLPGRENTVASVSYSHDDLFGSQLEAQLYYQDSSARTVPEDNRRTIFRSVSQTAIESEKIGTRVQIDTPVLENFNLLWGVDYVRESITNPLIDFDPVAFTRSRGTVFRPINERFFAPPYDVSNLGIFAQGSWEANDDLSLSGGLRFERIGLSVEDYNVLGTPSVGRIQGGDIDFSDVVFNIGTVYNLTANISAFANFSQGFSAPDFGRILRLPTAFRSVENSLKITQPLVVDSYEIGLRGDWGDVKTSVAGFFSYSETGQTVRPSPDGSFLILERAPQRVYGIEATLDWQVAPTWAFGGIFSWVEGESENDRGEFIALGTRDIQPLKLTFYVQNETLPNWTNRLQALYVGGRDRAVEAGVDRLDIDSYFVMDFLSSYRLSNNSSLRLGIQNILDTQYFPVDSQLQTLNSRYTAGLGRTFSLEYTFKW
jgi:iron complex outermembrane receptor protein